MTTTSRIADRVHAGEYRSIHAVVVMQGDEVVCEEYFEGPDENLVQIVQGRNGQDFRPGALHDCRSVTKSVTSLLYGIALDRGVVPGVDEPIIDHLPEYADLRTPEVERIRVRHALTMTLGIEWDETISYADPRNSEIQMHTSDDPWRYVLSRPIVTAPGESFTYCGGATELIAGLIERGTGEVLDEFAREVIFDPLGVAEFEWARPDHGHPMAASGLRLRAPDLARIARLCLTEEIVPAGWIATALEPHVEVEGGINYGFQWWLSNTGRIASACGNGGQRATVIRESDLVCVVFAGNYNESGDSESDRLITECVLPAAGLSATTTWWEL